MMRVMIRLMMGLTMGLTMSLQINNVHAQNMHNVTNKHSNIRIAAFNVSMEALNYTENKTDQQASVTGKELHQALQSDHQQIKNIAEIIQRIDPDILLLNEFDYTDDQGKNLQLFVNNYLAVSQGGQTPIEYKYYFQAPVNTGVIAKNDLNGDGQITLPNDTYGFGYYPGHYGMALLSKFPIDNKQIRTFQNFKWKNMPGALIPKVPETNTNYYSEQAWDDFRLSSKSHWDIPLIIKDKIVHVLASHPTPPVFDGPEDRNGKRNHDEIRFWLDYISENNQYIYDDNNQYGGLANDAAFVIMGDQNASATEGNAINTAISQLLSHRNIADPLPQSLGAQQHTPDNKMAKYHTASWRMRADYVIPSKNGLKIKDSGVFWPSKNQPEYRLIKSRKDSSDHRLVWLDIQLTDQK